MTWTPVESTDVVAIGWEDTQLEPRNLEDEPIWAEFQLAPVPTTRGIMGIQFHRPFGATYLYYDVPAEFFQEFLDAPSKGQFVNFTIKRSGLAYTRVA